jgi:hypothetical protein
MSEQEETHQNAAEPLRQEGCLCREIVNQFREAFGVSPKVKEHFTNSRIEFLKGIRAVIDGRIEHLSNAGQRGTKIGVE